MKIWGRWCITLGTAGRKQRTTGKYWLSNRILLHCVWHSISGKRTGRHWIWASLHWRDLDRYSLHRQELLARGHRRIISSMNRGQRIIVVHAGGRQGFIPGALLTYKAASHTGDYHSEMDGNNFTKWVKERLIPNLDQPSAIVMDNTSYHSMRTDKCPTSSTRKADIQDWLRRHGVPFWEERLKLSCWSLCASTDHHPRTPLTNCYKVMATRCWGCPLTIQISTP